MKLALLILLIASKRILAHKRVTTLDITGEFPETDFTEQTAEGSTTPNINYTLRPDLQIVRVVDGPIRIWQSLHVGEKCTYCHVTNHNGKPAICLLYIQHFNSFYTVRRYRLFHGTWVPISKIFFNEIAKAISGFEGLEYDLDLDLSKSFDLSKVTISKQASRMFKHYKITPNVGYHIDIVRYEETILWQKTPYQEEVLEANMIIEFGNLTQVSLLYETYYKMADTLYFKFDKEWKQISRKEYYHKDDLPNTLIPYKFPASSKEKSRSKKSKKGTGESKEKDETEPTQPTKTPIDYSRPLLFRRFPRPCIRHDNVTGRGNDLYGYGGAYYGSHYPINPSPSEIIVLDDSDDDDTTQSGTQTTTEQTQQTSTSTSFQTRYIQLSRPTHGTSAGVSDPTYIYQAPLTTTQIQPSSYPQYPQMTTTGQYQQQEQSQRQYTYSQQQPTSEAQTTQQGYVWYGHEDSSSETEQQVYSWYGYQGSSSNQTEPQYSCTQQETPTTQQSTQQGYVWYGQQETTTSSQEQPQYTYVYQQPTSTYQAQHDAVYGEQQPSTSSQTQTQTQGETQQQYGSYGFQEQYTSGYSQGYLYGTSSQYRYEPITIGESLRESICPYQEQGEEQTQPAPSSEPTQDQSNVDQYYQAEQSRLRKKSSDAASKSDQWHWYKQPQAKSTGKPPAKKKTLPIKKVDRDNSQIRVISPEPQSDSEDTGLEEIPQDYMNILSKSDTQLEKDLTFFESYYMDFQEEDSYCDRHKKRRGDRAIYLERLSDIDVKGKNGVDINLYELDDANPNYTIEVQSYYSVPIFKITPGENKFFKEVNSDDTIVWKNQDKGMCLVIKVVMINGEFGAVEAVVKRYSNKCYLHYRYERGYYRSIHTPTYLSVVSNYALELHEEGRRILDEETEKTVRRQREAAKKAGLDEREAAVRRLVKSKGEDLMDLRFKGRPKKKAGDKKATEEEVYEAEPLCLTSYRKGRGTKRKKPDVIEEEDDED